MRLRVSFVGRKCSGGGPTINQLVHMPPGAASHPRRMEAGCGEGGGKRLSGLRSSAAVYTNSGGMWQSPVPSLTRVLRPGSNVRSYVLWRKARMPRAFQGKYRRHFSLLSARGKRKRLAAVRADRMRGGRNKFGPMYKRDRARKLQMLRQKQLALSQCSSAGGSEASGAGGGPLGGGSAGVHYALPPSASVSSPGLYSPEPGGPIKQEIQIPQLSSSTSSPDSSPSPLAGLAAPPQPPPTPTWLTQGPSSPPKPFPAAYEPGPLGAGDEAKVPALVREFQKNMLDDKEWQTQLFGLLQNQTYNQCEVDLFELMCKVIDQSLFAQVDWARSTIFFKDLRVSTRAFECLTSLAPFCCVGGQSA
ncbi:hypothetical protein HPB48_009368 [Haemaphysalis longicornis]|uniref:Nuclear hormone receptor FTZ-F1 n=1 Tax=Haemaphysalis longicornis TaxID=44386 RepID=A0A9J6F712_HAELO|nr:hypothetical protein HPB48_009368 [Haemaphysalis longicornis]